MIKNQSIFRFLTLGIISTVTFLTSCSTDDENIEPLASNFFVGIESTAKTDILVGATDLNLNDISPINNGIAQPAWMTFYQAGETILSAGYTNANIITGYRLVDGKLKDIGNLDTEKGVYALGDIDDNTIVAIGLDRSGFSEREIYTINVSDMSVTNTVKTNWDKREKEGLMTFPTDIAIKDNKAFISYYLLDADGKFQTPNSNQARVAVYSYPEWKFEKIITDDRTSDLGRYLSQNVLEETENGDIYTFASSALANGFFPTPTNPGGILRIKNGTTEFDKDYFFNVFEKSGGYKINDFAYVGNGKAIARVFKEDPTNADYLWGTYAPTAPIGICEIAILDLKAQIFTKVEGVPNHAGSWSFAHLIQRNTVYVNTSDENGAAIYVVDVEKATAVKGSKIIGNYAKGIFALK